MKKYTAPLLLIFVVLAILAMAASANDKPKQPTYLLEVPPECIDKMVALEPCPIDGKGELHCGKVKTTYHCYRPIHKEMKIVYQEPVPPSTN